MKRVFITIKATCSFNCEVEVPSEMKVSQRKIAEMINSGELLPNILSENSYDFHGRSLTIDGIENEGDE